MPNPNFASSLYNSVDLESKTQVARSQHNILTTKIYKVIVTKEWSQFKVNWLPELRPGNSIAIKVFCDENDRESAAALCNKEASWLLSFNHKHIVTIFAYDSSSSVRHIGHPSFLMELGEMSLNKLLIKDNETGRYIVPHELFPGNKNELYTSSHMFTWLNQIAEAMNYLHSGHFLHRDLKSHNILLFNYATVCKLCDFETCRSIDPSGMTNKTGTSRWMAPEVKKSRQSLQRESKPTCKYGKPADCFSFGVVMCEAIFREVPFTGYSNHEISYPDDQIPERPPGVAMRIVQGGDTPRIVIDRSRSVFPNLPENFWSLLEGLLAWGPDQRPNFDKVLNVLSGRAVENLPTIRIGAADAVQTSDTGIALSNGIENIRMSGFSNRVFLEPSCVLALEVKTRILDVLTPLLPNISVRASKLPQNQQIEQQVKNVINLATFNDSDQLVLTSRAESSAAVDAVCAFCRSNDFLVLWLHNELLADDPTESVSTVKFSCI